MPEIFAQHFIEITGVRCERVQYISDEDCLKEGIMQLNTKFGNTHSSMFKYDKKEYFDYGTPQQAYAALFNKINGKGAWEANPFVWIYDFKLKKQ